MKGKSFSEEKNRQAMRWSKVVKGNLLVNQEVRRYPLEAVVFPKETEHPLRSEEEASTEVAEAQPESETEIPASEYEEGYVKGKSVGNEQGYAKGFTEGESKGRERGYAEGLAEGTLSGHEQGYAKGFEEGTSAGSEIREEELCEYENTHRLLLRLIDDLKDFTENIVQETENDVLQIAIDIAQKIIRKEISENPELLLGSVQEALQNVGALESVQIRVHPQDMEMLIRKRPELLSAVEGMTRLTFEPDPKLLPGDCIVEGPDRIVDARAASQLAIIKENLLPQSNEGRAA